VYESAIYEHLEKKGFKVASNYKVGDNTVILIDLDEQDEKKPPNTSGYGL